MKLFSSCTVLAVALLLAMPPAAIASQPKAVASQPTPVRILVPTRFEHQRILVTARLADGASMLFYTDSGGGLNMVRDDVAQRLGLSPGADVEEEGQAPIKTVEWPAFANRASIPSPDHDRFLQGRLAVVPAEGFGEGPMLNEGFLGSRWFAGRVWEFDYPASSLSVLQDWTAPAGARNTPLTMLLDRNMYWPRIQVEIGGEQLDMLFDTGAELRLGQMAPKRLGLPKARASRAASSPLASTASGATRTRIGRWH